MVEYANTYKLYKCKETDFKKKVELLVKMIEIYDSKELSETDKAYQLFKLCNKVSEFETRYRLLFQNGSSDFRLEGIYQYIPLIYKKLKGYEKIGYEEDFAAIRILERKIVSYEEAKMLVFAYIESELFVEEHIFDDIGVTSLEFEKNVKLVKSVAPKLYSQYLAKKAKNLILRYDDCINSFIDIANAIETGYFGDGTKFSLLEFWSRVPFKENYKNYDLELKKLNPNLDKFGFDFINRVKPFIKAVLPQKQQDVILNFMIENRIKAVSNTMTLVDVKNRYGGLKKVIKRYIDESNEEVLIEFDFTLEDFQNIIDYMNLRKMPLIYEIFECVLFEYVKGNITKNIINEMKGSSLNRKKC